MPDRRMIMKRFGGSSQLRIDSVDDLRCIALLPEAHWAILSCPVKGLNCDERFLELIDDDKDGRIGTSELKSNIAWCLDRLNASSNFDSDQCTLSITELTDKAEDLKKAIPTILSNLGIEEKQEITLDQIRKRDAILKDAGANGDGVITVNCLDEQIDKDTATAISSCVTLVAERNGNEGLNKELLAQFKDLRDKAIALYEQGRSQQFWQDQTASVVKAVQTLRQEIDDWFELSHLRQVNPELAQQFIQHQNQISNARDRSAIDQAMATQLISDPTGTLHWDQIRQTHSGSLLLSIKDICFNGSTSITSQEWAAVLIQVDAYLKWEQSCSENSAFQLGEEKLKGLNDEAVARLEQQCDEDAALAEDISHIDDLERLILCKRWLLPFTNNFVSLPHLFDHTKRAMFEQGTLLIAGREYHLAVSVDNRKEHIALAKESGMCICYIEVTGDQPPRKFEVAVPITAGTRSGLFKGRRGIFHDIKGRRLEAKIVHLLDNPVSIKEAVVQPFSRITKFFSNKIEEWSSSVDKKFEQQVDSVVTDKAQAPKAPAQAAPQTNIGGALMGGSVAFAALGSSIAFITKQLSEIQPLKIVLGLGILVILIMIPTAIVAYLKLRRRNLSALLQASLWAVNDRMVLSYSLARLLSSRPALPSGAVSETRDEIENILKSQDIEDDRVGSFRIWALLFILLAGSLAVADAILGCCGHGHYIWITICTSLSSILAFSFGVRGFNKRILLISLLFIMLLGSLYNTANYLL